METAHGAGRSWGVEQLSAIVVKWKTDQNVVCSACNCGKGWSAAHINYIRKRRCYLRFLHWCWYRLSLLRCYAVSSVKWPTLERSVWPPPTLSNGPGRLYLDLDLEGGDSVGHNVTSLKTWTTREDFFSAFWVHYQNNNVVTCVGVAIVRTQHVLSFVPTSLERQNSSLIL
jgi:hypothetical protein